MDNTFRFEEDGKQYKIIKILSPSNLEYQYIVYTADGTNIYASRYELIDGKVELSPIIEEYEWDYIDKEMEGIYNG